MYSKPEAGEVIAFLYDRGWKVVPCSCSCGGRWAWVKPCPPHSEKMVGCVCHNTPFVVCVDDDGEREIKDYELDVRSLRISGDVVCQFCEKTAYEHPLEKRILGIGDKPFLNRMCNGTLAKL